MRFVEGQRVVVQQADGIIINAVGKVHRLRSDGAAWVELDKRSVAGVHRFAAHDPRGKLVFALPENCELPGRTGKQRRAKERAERHPGGGEIPLELFGKDHWSTFGYLEHCAVERRGQVEIVRMRCDPGRHPLLAHEGSRFGSPSPTRLKAEGVLIHNHDDWDCAEDLERVGLLTNVGSHVNPLFQLTPMGRAVATQLRAHKEGGGVFGTFVPELDGAAAEAHP